MVTPGQYLSFLDTRLPGLVVGAHVYGSRVLDSEITPVLWQQLRTAGQTVAYCRDNVVSYWKRLFDQVHAMPDLLLLVTT